MTDPTFDSLAAWRVLRDHLDTMTLEAMCARLGLRVKISATTGDRGPMVCPRQECRSPDVFTVGPAWTCLGCGAMGGAAAIFAGHVADWEASDGDDDAQTRADFERLAHWALLENLVDPAEAKWRDLYDTIPGFDAWSVARPGVYEGADRAAKLSALALALARGRTPGRSISRVVRAVNAQLCRPPLKPAELATILVRLAEAA